MPTGVQTGPKLDGNKPEDIIQMEPDWYTGLKPQEGYIVGKGEGTSPSKVGARKIAVNNLAADLSQKTKTITEGRSDDFGQTGGDYDSSVRQKFEQSQVSIWNSAIEGYEEIQSVTLPERSENAQGQKITIYRTYIAGKINRLAADQGCEQIKMQEELLTAVQANKAYETAKDLEKYKKQFGMD